MNPSPWFEIPVVDMSRAKAFYEKVLGVSLDLHDMGPMQMAWFPMENDAYGSTGSLVKMDGYAPSAQGVVLYFSTADIEAVLARAEAAGGRALLPRTDIGEYGFIAQFLDSEGNRVALHTPKEMPQA